MIFYCSLVFSPTSFYAIKTPKGIITCTPLDAIDFSNLNEVATVSILRYWKAMVDRELANFGCGNGDLVYYSVLVSKLTNQVANSVRNASVACEMDFAGSVSIEEDSDSVIRYLKHAGVVGKDTVTVVNLSSHLVEVKTVLLEEQLGQRTGSGMGIYALDPIFLNLIIQKYPQVRKVLEASQVVAKEFLISFKQLKHAFENGSQWTTGAYRIGIPPALKHLFKDDTLEIKVQELRDIYEPLVQNILQVLTTHINNGYENDERFKLQQLKLLYIGKQSAYMTARLETFARVNNLGVVKWACEIEKMTMIGAVMKLEANAVKRQSGDDDTNVPFKVPKLEEFFKSRDDNLNTPPSYPAPPPPQVVIQRPVSNSVPYTNHAQPRPPTQPHLPMDQRQYSPQQRPRQVPLHPQSLQSSPQRMPAVPAHVPNQLQYSPQGMPAVSTPLPYQRQPSLQRMPAVPTPLPNQRQPSPQPRPAIPTPIQNQRQSSPQPRPSVERQPSPPIQPLDKQLPPPPTSKFNPESTLKFETESHSETPSIPTLINLYTLGADPSSSLHTSIINLNKPLFDFLMTLDIDLEWRDEDGNTALLVASACGSEEMVTTIISKNPNLDSLNKSGSNCVICATQNENRERVLELVITAGGDCRVVNRYGTGVERAIMELDVSGEEKERLMGIVGRVDDQIMNINF